MTGFDRVRGHRTVAATALLAAALSLAAGTAAVAEDNAAPAAGAQADTQANTQAGAQAGAQANTQVGTQPGSAVIPAGPTAVAQRSDNAAPPAPSGSSFPAQPPAVNTPGFLSDVGKWWTDSFGNFGTKMQNAQHQIADLNKKQNAAAQQAMKDAATATATAVVRLPNTRIFELHQLCALAPNGAPDCQTAAATACRGKGFAGGQPLDVSTAEKCSASLWLSGQPPAAADCPVETVMLRVVCQ